MIDARRLSCPMPVVMLQKVIAKDHFPAALEILGMPGQRWRTLPATLNPRVIR